MSDFKESIRGKYYTIDEAKQCFENYVRSQNGYLSNRFTKCDIQIINGNLVGNSTALGNTSVADNLIRLKPNPSIITLWHECRHLSDSWQDKDGEWYACWEYEKNYEKQMRYVDVQNKVIHIDRGVHGKFMGEAVAELYATKMYWNMCSDRRAAESYTMKRTEYDEEVVTFKKICTVLGMDEDMLLNMSSKDDYVRKYVRNAFTQITGDSKFWDLLEFRLDYVAMDKLIAIAQNDFKIDKDSREGIGICRKKANEMIKQALDLSRDKGIITVNEYNQRNLELNRLDAYSGTNR